MIKIHLLNIEIYNMKYDRAKEFFLGENRCELAIEDEEFWKRKNGHEESPAELNFEILIDHLEA